MNPLQRQFVLLGTLLVSTLACAQSLPWLNNMTPAVTLVSPSLVSSSLLSPSMITPVTAIIPAKPPCAKPAEAFDIDDYSGPFSQLVSRFSERIENTTVHIPRRHGLKPCSLSVGDKFHMFVESTTDPLNYLGAAWDAATAQMDRDDPSYRMGMSGYGKRFGAANLDNVSGDFFGVFLYPALFRQDPRYYRLGQGSTTQARMGHALAHRFVTRGDSGRRMPNYSEWFGTVSSKALSNLYHPGNPRGFGPTASRVGFSVANDMAWDVVREFWPEITHKLRLPFKARREPFAVNSPVKRAPVKVETIAANDLPAIEPVR